MPSSPVQMKSNISYGQFPQIAETYEEIDALIPIPSQKISEDTMPQEPRLYDVIPQDPRVDITTKKRQVSTTPRSNTTANDERYVETPTTSSGHGSVAAPSSILRRNTDSHLRKKKTDADGADDIYEKLLGAIRQTLDPHLMEAFTQKLQIAQKNTDEVSLPESSIPQHRTPPLPPPLSPPLPPPPNHPPPPLDHPLPPPDHTLQPPPLPRREYCNEVLDMDIYPEIYDDSNNEEEIELPPFPKKMPPPILPSRPLSMIKPRIADDFCEYTSVFTQ